MEKFRKLSRNDLRSFTGAGTVGDPVLSKCPTKQKWCEKQNKCVAVGINCDLIPNPGDGGGF